MTCYMHRVKYMKKGLVEYIKLLHEECWRRMQSTKSVSDTFIKFTCAIFQRKSIYIYNLYVTWLYNWFNLMIHNDALRRSYRDVKSDNYN